MTTTAVPPTTPSKPSLEDISRLRTIRSEGIIPSATLAAQSATIIGCGAVGHQVCRLLAGLGFKRLILWDFDEVSVENLGPQQWDTKDLGSNKAEVCYWEAHAMMNEGSELLAMKRAFTAADKIETPIVFCCVDNMDVRRTIAEQFKATAPHSLPSGDPGLFIDTRMTAQYFEVHTAMKRQIDTYLADTIFPQQDGDPLPCTLRATAYCSNTCASFAVHFLIQHLIGNSIPEWFGFDLFSLLIAPNPHLKAKAHAGSQATPPPPPSDEPTEDPQDNDGPG